MVKTWLSEEDIERLRKCKSLKDLIEILIEIFQAGKESLAEG